MCAGFHVAVGPAGLGQREPAVDHGGQLPGFHERPDIGEHALQYFVLFGGRPGPQGRGVDASPFAHQQADVQLPALPALVGDEDQSAVAGESVKVPVEIVAADRVQDDVRATPLCRILSTETKSLLE